MWGLWVLGVLGAWWALRGWGCWGVFGGSGGGSGHCGGVRGARVGCADPGAVGCRCRSPRGAGVPSRVLGLELHLPGRELLVAFAGCLVRLPLSRCARHGSCRG